MPVLSQARFDEIYRIRCDGDQGRSIHPDYAAIKDAERRFVDEPIVDYYVKTGLYPDRLRYSRPATEFEAVAQWVGAALLNHCLGRPVAIEFTTPPLKPPKRIAHAFRVVRRILTRRN